jgi:hypothetical protein
MARAGFGPAARDFRGPAAEVNPFLRMSWRGPRRFGTSSGRQAWEYPGCRAYSSSYRLNPPSRSWRCRSTFAAIPFLVFAAPFIIMRNTIRGRRIERRRFEFVMIATVIAGIWSLMSGTVVVMAFEQIARAVG